jgi:hypothetical protein
MVKFICYTLPYGMRYRSLANFVGVVVGFFNVCIIRLRRLLLAASLSFESEWYEPGQKCPAQQKKFINDDLVKSPTIVIPVL